MIITKTRCHSLAVLLMCAAYRAAQVFTCLLRQCCFLPSFGHTTETSGVCSSLLLGVVNLSTQEQVPQRTCTNMYSMDFRRTKLGRFMNNRVPSSKRYQPTEYEHAANCATHGFIMSTMFHTVSWKKSHLRKVEQRFHMCDRMVIYFFIAASYAPWLNLRELGPWAVHMRWLVWIMACAGSAYVFFFHEKNKILDLLCYTAMGAVPAVVLLSVPNREGILELSVGGVFYCLGIVFFKSDGLIPFAHAIWHVFVAVGAGIHYYAIWRYLYATGTGQIKISR
ncbi:monocyte to macrophage differentiation factor 2-like [Sinocyclocheilus anshuiensis]|uniref:monocyte to macrophage differentiation factor 2-like n=1 Tax=Sinocyclocheilus anshuiensis TaxID=1608454 RepID=UPI0007B88497|nr:PREDICTED: monocyte to macrophage differentiation factor 2-like [Sinocyclocheilus anshuiensis]